MKTFNVYNHPAKGLEAVKVGFSWPALFFNGIWMLVTGLWRLAGLWFFLCLFLVFIEFSAAYLLAQEEGIWHLLGLLAVWIGYIILLLFPAFKGNSWREKNLLEQGYEFQSSVSADTKDGAIALAFKEAKSDPKK